MRRKKRNFIYLAVAIFSLLSLILLVLFMRPTEGIPLGFMSIPFLFIFFLLLILFSFSLPAFLLRSKKHGILISLFVTSFFLFRIFNLTHPLFSVLLLGLFFTLELLFTSKQA